VFGTTPLDRATWIRDVLEAKEEAFRDALAYRDPVGTDYLSLWIKSSNARTVASA